jgi:CTP-dependent riboflavin kinase
MNGHPCHLIDPDRSHYKDVIEFIARDCLREALHVKDNDLVQVAIEES